MLYWLYEQRIKLTKRQLNTLQITPRDIMKNMVFLGTFFFCIFSSVSYSASFNLGERVIIDSKILIDERELQILVPESYYSNSEATYPVIYLLDGDYNFHGVSGMLDLLGGKGQLIPDVILVGVADKGTSKYRQFMTPSVYDSKAKESQGKAAEFMRFLTEEVKPYIHKNYRSGDHSTLMGHSMGGLFVINTLIEKPEAFRNYVAVSPSVWLADQGIVAKAKEKMIAGKHSPVSLYLSLADEIAMGQYDFINYLDLAEPSHINWQFTHYPDENHNSVGIIALRDSLKDIYQQWYISEKQLVKYESPELIVSHYQKLMSSFGFNQAIPSASIKSMVRHYYRHDKIEQLPQFIEEAVKKIPASKQAIIAMQASYAGHFDTPKAALILLKAVEKEFENTIEHIKSIASTYEQLDDQVMALRYYNKALVLAKKQHASQWQFNIINAKIIATAKSSL
jgi:predicted alpha/beta superfamily hydrolase